MARVHFCKKKKSNNMLNIFNLKLKNNKPALVEHKGNDLGRTRHYPPAIKEWFNSIYAFNKNTPKLLPTADKVIIKLIKSYFNLFSRKLERKIKSRRLRRWMRRLSTNRILVSRAELKHTSDKVNITLYIYNRQKRYFLNKEKRIATLRLLNKIQFSRKMKLLKIKVYKVISKVRKEKDLLLNSKTLRWENDNFKNYEMNYYASFLKKSFEKEMLFMYLKQIIFFNKLKFEKTYLLPLKSLIDKVYNKKVEFNLVNIKYLHLNSDIFSGILAIKLRNRKNKLLRVLKASIRKVKLPSLNKLAILDEVYNRQKIAQILKIKDLISHPLFIKAKIQNNDALDQILGNFIKLNVLNEFKSDLENTVLNSIKHIPVSGIRIEASGRLTRRITAARSVFKVKYLGNLRNLDSSYKGFSSVMLRGHVRSNLQHTKLYNKTRIGAFGIKGWISSI